jgi:hypothetical protein
LSDTQAPGDPGACYFGCGKLRYFFNICAEDGTVTDFVGADLAGIQAVRDYAAAHVIELWEARVMAGKPPLVGWLDVIDEHSRAVFRIPL